MRERDVREIQIEVDVSRIEQNRLAQRRDRPRRVAGFFVGGRREAQRLGIELRSLESAATASRSRPAVSRPSAGQRQAVSVRAGSPVGARPCAARRQSPLPVAAAERGRWPEHAARRAANRSTHPPCSKCPTAALQLPSLYSRTASIACAVGSPGRRRRIRFSSGTARRLPAS